MYTVSISLLSQDSVPGVDADPIACIKTRENGSRERHEACSAVFGQLADMTFRPFKAHIPRRRHRHPREDRRENVGVVQLATGITSGNRACRTRRSRCRRRGMQA